MYVSHLSLANFRNYAALDADLPPGLIVLHGGNAQGKSNLVEALYYVATSRSPRTGVDRALIRHGDDAGYPVATRASARVARADGVLLLEIALMATPGSSRGAARASENGDGLAFGSGKGVRKQIRINGIPRRALDLLGGLRVVLFRPEDMGLVGGAPGDRRRALDILLAQMDPEYTRALQRYNRVLLQRNHLLRRIGEGRATPDELAPWDSPLAAAGALLLSRRVAAVDRIAPLAGEHYTALSRAPERLDVTYRSAIAEDGAIDDPGALAERFAHQLRNAQRREIALGQTVTGPHRDDVDYRLDGEPAALYGSRGQQRTAVLAWKLAEAGYLRERTGEDPVVLLDDILSELDEQRRHGVLASVSGYQQVLLTIAEAELSSLQPQPAAQFRVQAGTLIAEKR